MFGKGWIARFEIVQQGGSIAGIERGKPSLGLLLRRGNCRLGLPAQELRCRQQHDTHQRCFGLDRLVQGALPRSVRLGISCNRFPRLGQHHCRSPKTHPVFGINDIAAAAPFPFCYNCPPCFDLSNSASERWFTFFTRDRVSSERIWHCVSNYVLKRRNPRPGLGNSTDSSG